MKVALLLFFLCLVEADDLRWEFDALKSSLEEKLERQNTEMAAKLTASETQMLKLQLEFLQIKLSSSDQQHQVHLLQSRLSSSDNNVEALKQQSLEMAAKLSASEKELTDLQTKLSTTEHRVQVQVDTLKNNLSSCDNQVQLLQNKLTSRDNQNQLLQVKLTSCDHQHQAQLLQIKLNCSDQQNQILQTKLTSDVEALKKESQESAAKLSASEKELTHQQTKLSTTEHQVQVLQTKLSTTEHQVQVLQTKLSTTEHQVQVVQTKLSSTEHQVQVHHTRLSSSDDNLETLKEESQAQVAQLSSIETHLNATDNQVQELRNKPKVAFSAGLGPGTVSSPTTVVYKNVFTNIGNAYNPSTGIFTSAFRGVYHFSFTAAHYQASTYVNIQMYKNDQRLICNAAWSVAAGQWESVSNGMILELKKGDTVYMKLPSGTRLDDDGNTYNNNMFSGFLISPL